MEGLGLKDASILSLLADTARAGYRGEGGYNVDTGNFFGNTSANQHGIDYNRQATYTQGEVTRDKIKDVSDCNRHIVSGEGAHTRDKFSDGLNRVSQSFEEAERSRQFADNMQGRFQTELRMTERLAALQHEMNENARRSADCCCDVKLQACKDKSELLQRMEQINKENVLRDLSRAENELTSLKAQIACGCCPDMVAAAARR